MRSIFKNTYKKGVLAEYYAAVYLTFKGYRIVNMRYKTKVGEVDIIAKRGRTIAFIEVKMRKSEEDAKYAVHPRSQSRIRRAAEYILLGQVYESHIIRFDVITIHSNYIIRHIKNAF